MGDPHRFTNQVLNPRQQLSRQSERRQSRYARQPPPGLYAAIRSRPRLNFAHARVGCFARLLENLSIRQPCCSLYPGPQPTSAGGPARAEFHISRRAIFDTFSVPQAHEKMGREAKEDVEMEDDHDDVDLGVDEESSVWLSVGFGARVSCVPRKCTLCRSLSRNSPRRCRRSSNPR